MQAAVYSLLSVLDQVQIFVEMWKEVVPRARKSGWQLGRCGQQSGQEIHCILLWSCICDI